MIHVWIMEKCIPTSTLGGIKQQNLQLLRGSVREGFAGLLSKDISKIRNKFEPVEDSFVEVDSIRFDRNGK